DERTLAGDGTQELGMARRVEPVYPTGHDRHGVSVRGQGPAVCGRVDAIGATGDDCETSSTQTGSQVCGSLGAVGGRAPGTDDGDAAFGGRTELDGAAHPQAQRRHGKVAELRGPLGVGRGEDPRPELVGVPEVLLELLGTEALRV